MIKRSNIKKAIHDGCFEAHRKFKELPGKDSKLAEGCVVSEILFAINQDVEMRLEDRPMVEFPFGYIDDLSGTKAKGRPYENIGKIKRVDICLLDSMKRPIYILEVKSLKGDISLSKYEKDLERLANLMDRYGSKNGGSLQGGFLSIYCRRDEGGLEDEISYARKFIHDLDKVYKIKKKGIGVRCYSKSTQQYGSFIIEFVNKKS